MSSLNHASQTGADNIHEFAVRSESDPGAIGAGKGWFKPSTGVLKIRNDADDGWIDLTAGGTAGDLAAHLADTVDAHDASAISYGGGTGMSATDVEAAVDELATGKANASDLTAHTGDTSDAHDASAISFVPAGTIAATDVQAAIEEVATETAAAVPSASETVQGKIEIADDTEAGAHTDDTRAMTPLKTYDNFIPRTSGLGVTLKFLTTYKFFRSGSAAATLTGKGWEVVFGSQTIIEIGVEYDTAPTNSTTVSLKRRNAGGSASEITTVSVSASAKHTRVTGLSISLSDLDALRVDVTAGGTTSSDMTVVVLAEQS